MIEREIVEIINDVDDNGERLNEIADQFRNDRSTNDLLVLIDSNDPEKIGIGLWILNELHFEKYCTDHFISRLSELVHHENPAVRFHALGALYPTLNQNDIATRALLDKMSHDPNDGVRKRAKAAARSLSLK